jgi:hypothetical protein
VDRAVNAWPAGANLYNAAAIADPLAPSAWTEAVIGLPEPISCIIAAGCQIVESEACTAKMIRAQCKLLKGLK